MDLSLPDRQRAIRRATAALCQQLAWAVIHELPLPNGRRADLLALRPGGGFVCIDDHRRAYGVKPICRVLPIAPSTYRAHAARRAEPTRLPEIETTAPGKRKFKTYALGYLHIDIPQVQTAQGRLYLLVAIDRVTKFASTKYRD